MRVKREQELEGPVALRPVNVRSDTDAVRMTRAQTTKSDRRVIGLKFARTSDPPGRGARFCFCLGRSEMEEPFFIS